MAAIGMGALIATAGAVGIGLQQVPAASTPVSNPGTAGNSPPVVSASNGTSATSPAQMPGAVGPSAVTISPIGPAPKYSPATLANAGSLGGNDPPGDLPAPYAEPSKPPGTYYGPPASSTPTWTSTTTTATPSCKSYDGYEACSGLGRGPSAAS